VEFRRVVDLTWVLVLEVYREYGMKFEEAFTELESKLYDPSDPEASKPRPKPPPDNDASLAMLQAMMGGSDFGGPSG